MSRGLIAAAVFGLAALPAAAADYYGYPTPGNSGYVAPAKPGYGPRQSYVSPVAAWQGGAGHDPTCGSCNTGGGRRTALGDRVRKWLDFMFYKPQTPCDCTPTPTRYTSPLTAWFPCKNQACQVAGCGTTGRHGYFGASARTAPGMGGAATLGMPLTTMPAAHGPAPMYTTVPRIAALPMPPAGPVSTFTPPATSYTATKPAYSDRVNPPLAIPSGASRSPYLPRY